MTTSKETHMTRTPAPALTAVLDELDELRATALAIRQGYPSLPQILQNETEVEADWSDGGRSVLAECYGEDIAALIVAAVNRLPELTAALRAVERRIQDWDVMARELHHVPVAEAYADVVIGLRAAIATALEAS